MLLLPSGYKHTSGQRLSGDELQQLVQGLSDNNFLSEYDYLLSGTYSYSIHLSSSSRRSNDLLSLQQASWALPASFSVS